MRNRKMFGRLRLGESRLGIETPKSFTNEGNDSSQRSASRVSKAILSNAGISTIVKFKIKAYFANNILEYQQ